MLATINHIHGGNIMNVSNMETWMNSASNEHKKHGIMPIEDTPHVKHDGLIAVTSLFSL